MLTHRWTRNIILVDSSTDSTPEKATAKGVRVVKASRKGLGRAYQEGIPQIRGNYVIMEMPTAPMTSASWSRFCRNYGRATSLLMGSRFKGYIQPDSMPALHRYFGPPLRPDSELALWNALFRHSLRDAWHHYGSPVRMKLESESWQYASEMVLKSVHMKLRTAEVPVRFFKDPEGRLSHHKRAGWLSPWKAGWSNLEVMLTHGAEFFTLRPGLVLIALGLLFTLPLVGGPIQIGRFTFLFTGCCWGSRLLWSVCKARIWDA